MIVISLSSACYKLDESICGINFNWINELFCIFFLGVDMMKWSSPAATGCIPSRRSGHSAISVETRMFLFGGVGDSKFYNDLYVLDTGEI